MKSPPGADDTLLQTIRSFRRQALHATRLEFSHPVTVNRIQIEAPAPADFQHLLEALREHARQLKSK